MGKRDILIMKVTSIPENLQKSTKNQERDVLNTPIQRYMRLLLSPKK